MRTQAAMHEFRCGMADPKLDALMKEGDEEEKAERSPRRRVKRQGRLSRQERRLRFDLLRREIERIRQEAKTTTTTPPPTTTTTRAPTRIVIDTSLSGKNVSHDCINERRQICN